MSVPTVLEKIVARKFEEVAARRAQVSLAELEAAALRSYPRAVSLEEQLSDLLPEVMIGVDAQSFAEIAAAVLWLLRDATYTTGQVLRLDGGRMLAG